MTIQAIVIEDSIAASNGVRLTTLQLTYPRFIHAEFMTHRVFSRNASSSRAIPVEKMIAQVRSDPAMPVHWGKNQPGMQAMEELTGADLAEVKAQWATAARMAATSANVMMQLGAHKQVVNRILEPFQHIHVIVTATEWDNFFELRDHPDAQPEIRVLAAVMRAAMKGSHVTALEPGEWHLPYVTADERKLIHTDKLLKISAARCARVSYLNHDGQKPDMNRDLELYDRLVGSKPLHASPVEHQATPMDGRESAGWWSGNFRGWQQHRKLLEGAIAA